MKFAGLLCVMVVLGMALDALAFSSGIGKFGLQALGRRVPKMNAQIARRTSMRTTVLSMSVSDEEFVALKKAVKDAPEDPDARAKLDAAMKIRSQEAFDRAVKGPELIGPVQKFKDENPLAWKAAQWLWLILVIVTAVAPGPFAAMFNGQ